MGEPGEDPVLILTGAPGAGKSTVARLLAERSKRAVHLESDWFFRFIAAGYIEPWQPESHEQNTIVMRIVALAAAGYANAGYFTIIDGIIQPRWFLAPLRDALRDAGHAVAYAVLRPPLDICTARAASRRTDRLSDPAVVEQIWREFADLGPLERHAIDVTAATAQDATDLVADRLRAGQLACDEGHG